MRYARLTKEQGTELKLKKEEIVLINQDQIINDYKETYRAVFETRLIRDYSHISVFWRESSVSRHLFSLILFRVTSIIRKLFFSIELLKIGFLLKCLNREKLEQEFMDMYELYVRINKNDLFSFYKSKV